MDNAEMLTPKEVGKRIKERRNEIGISMPELGRRVGVNKSTIQRYETDGVNPNRSMIINGLADALQTTPEWLTGLSEEKEVKDEDSRTICEGEGLDHLNSFLDAVGKTVQPEIQQRFLTSTLCLLIFNPMQYVVWRGKKEEYGLSSQEDGDAPATPTLTHEQFRELEEFLKKTTRPCCPS